MEAFFTVALVLHIAGGTLSLLAAPVALITRKGSVLHKRSGKIFFYGMSVVFVTGVCMSIAHENPFLFMIAFFSYQMVVSGERALHYKKLHSGQKIQVLDWLILLIAFAVNVCMIAWGSYTLMRSGDLLGIVSVAFGLTGMGFVIRDSRDFLFGNTDKAAWLFKHLGGMIGGYIAAVTAFLVVNFSGSLPMLIVWLGPAVLGTPIISYLTALYKRRLGRGHRLTELVQVSG